MEFGRSRMWFVVAETELAGAEYAKNSLMKYTYVYLATYISEDLNVMGSCIKH